MAKLFKMGFPLSKDDQVIDLVVQVFRQRERDVSKLDFKDFIRVMDGVTCRSLKDRLTWAAGLVSKGGKQRPVRHADLGLILRLLDLVEVDGFMREPTQDELNEVLFRKIQPMVPVDDRINMMLTRWGESDNSIVCIEYESLASLPENIVYARE